MLQFLRFLLVLYFSLIQSALWSQHADDNRMIFEPGIISTSRVEYGSSLSNDGQEIFFVRSNDPWGSPESKGTIYYSKKLDDRWTQPEVAFFSGVYDDSDPHLSQDGKSIYFISKGRDDALNQSPDIWLIRKSADGSWGKPERLGDPINSSAREYSPKTDQFGNLYFASDRTGGYGQGDLYFCRLENGRLRSPESLSSHVNSDRGEWNLEISDEGDILLFEASGRKENKSPYGDLYICFKKEDTWSLAQNINELNTTGSDLCPELISDNKILFYSSSDSIQSKNTDIYTIPFKKMLDTYRNNAVYPK